MRKFLTTLTALFALFLFGISTPQAEEMDYPPAMFYYVEGGSAHMYGVIDHTALKRLKALMKKHPDIHTLELMNVEGSVDDLSNFKLCDYIRSKGLNTHVPAFGLIASGGTDLFAAGVKRTADKGAHIGVHTWATDNRFGNVETGAELSKKHPVHKPYLKYFKKMGIPEAFYWFTLDAAPEDEIHWMSESELIQYKLLTLPESEK